MYKTLTVFTDTDLKYDKVDREEFYDLTEAKSGSTYEIPEPDVEFVNKLLADNKLIKPVKCLEGSKFNENIIDSLGELDLSRVIDGNSGFVSFLKQVNEEGTILFMGQ